MRLNDGASTKNALLQHNCMFYFIGTLLTKDVDLQLLFSELT